MFTAAGDEVEDCRHGHLVFAGQRKDDEDMAFAGNADDAAAQTF